MKHNLNQTGQIVAMLSFVIGTSLLAFFLYFGDDFVPLGLAFTFVIIAIIVNSLIFIAIIGSALLNKTLRQDDIKTCGLMLLNIPIAILYFYMVISFPYQNIIL